MGEEFAPVFSFSTGDVRHESSNPTFILERGEDHISTRTGDVSRRRAILVFFYFSRSANAKLWFGTGVCQLIGIFSTVTNTAARVFCLVMILIYFLGSF